ncbi:MAG: hypothetical protein JWO38_5742 [Gemmataceae bacterium]|nr:hypothetical protein [Gemmataceae bacterium]
MTGRTRLMVIAAACAAGLTLGWHQTSSGANGVPTCSSCHCATASAWLTKPSSTTSTGTIVLTTYDQNNPNLFGTVETDARWDTLSLVSASVCAIYDLHALADNNQHRQWIFDNISWSAQCSGAATSGYIAYIYSASPNYSIGELASRYDCGAQ